MCSSRRGNSQGQNRSLKRVIGGDNAGSQTAIRIYRRSENVIRELGHNDHAAGGTGIRNMDISRVNLAWGHRYRKWGTNRAGKLYCTRGCTLHKGLCRYSIVAIVGDIQASAGGGIGRGGGA